MKEETNEKIWTDFNEPDPKRMRLTKEELENFQLDIGENFILSDEDFQIEVIVGYFT